MSALFQIIVPVFNEEDTLEKVLAYAKEKDYLKHIVLVDDASTDSSLQILRNWAKSEGVLAISLKANRKKEGAIRFALEKLAHQGTLAPYTVILDSDSLIAPSENCESFEACMGRAIDYMEHHKLGGMAFQIDAIADKKMSPLAFGAFADYAAMQFDQWLVDRQNQLWVINGPGGIFDTLKLLEILRSIVPDFDTGDLLITVELMKHDIPIAFYPDIGVLTFVPTTLRAYFNQRRRWERGTTKVLWNERRFYLKCFSSFSLLALYTLIHLSLYVGILVCTIMILINRMAFADTLNILMNAGLLWLSVGVLKGLWLKTRRPDFPILRFLMCTTFVNGFIWTFITTPARITGFAEGIHQLFLSPTPLPTSNTVEQFESCWLQSENPRSK